MRSGTVFLFICPFFADFFDLYSFLCIVASDFAHITENKMIDFLNLSRILSCASPMQYMTRSGPGKSVSVYVSDKHPDFLYLRFERKITENDVVDGKLITAVLEKATKHGGKRSTELCLTYESALALQKVLKPALKDEKRRQKAQLSMGKLVDSAIYYFASFGEIRSQTPVR